MEYFSIEYALLAIQSALLKVVSPELRAVVINLDIAKQTFFAQVYYDSDVSEELIDEWDCAIAEASADLGPDCFVHSAIKRLDYPEKIPLGGFIAYMRKEDNSAHFTESGYSQVSIKEQSISYALLATQQALLAVVTPELRAVVVDFKNDERLLYIRFFYDGEVSKSLTDLWQNASLKVRCDFGGNCVLDGQAERVDFPKPIPFRGRYAFLRKE